MMSEDRKRILNMVAEGKISVAEAEQLLDALNDRACQDNIAGTGARGEGSRKAKYLRVIVQDGENRVNIRVPMQLLRAGVKLGNFIPDVAGERIGDVLREKGINVDLGEMKGQAIEDLIAQVGDLAVDVEGEGGETVRIFCE